MTTRTARSRTFAPGAAGLIALAIWAGLAVDTAHAGVEGETVVRGDVTFIRQGNRTLIQASDGSIINYASFDILPWETVRFIQPSDVARVLNRINGGVPTTIDGRLLANGHVYLVNPAGVMFGNGAVVNVGGIHAAAGAISDDDFVAGVDRFTDLTGMVVNDGVIRADEIHLVGDRVANHGTLRSTGGSAGVIAMVAGDEVFIRRVGDRIAVRVDGKELVDRANPHAGGTTPDMLATPGVENTGTIVATGGQVVLGAGDMFALAVRNEGTVTVGDGDITVAATDGLVQNDGRLRAIDRDGAGSITVQGPSVLNRGEIRADGADGAVEVTSTHHTYMTDGALVSARGLGHGDGGEILIHSYDGTTAIADGAAVDVRGGNAGGDGGFAEVSGATVILKGDVRLRADRGWEPGTLLIDPNNIVINDVGGDDGFLGDGLISFNENGNADTYIAASTLENIWGLIRLQAQGSIFVDAEVNLDLHNDVWFEAFDSIIFSEAINGARKLWLHADWDSDGIGFVSIAAPLFVTEETIFRGDQIRLQGGSITTGIRQIYNGPVLLGSDMTLQSGEIIFNGAIDSKATTPDRALAVVADTVYFNGTVGGFDHLREISVDAETWLQGGGVTTRLDQDWLGTVMLGADNAMVSWGGGDIRFHQTIDGAHSLYAQTGGGEIRFDGEVGGTTRLDGLTTGFGGTTHLDADVHADVIEIGNTLVLESDAMLEAPIYVGLSDVAGNGHDLDLRSPFTRLFGAAHDLGSLRTDADGETWLDGADIEAQRVDFEDAVRVAADSQVHGAEHVVFHSTVDGAYGNEQTEQGEGDYGNGRLTATSDEIVVFGDDVGADVALGGLTVEVDPHGAIDRNLIVFHGDTVVVEGDIELNAAGRDAPAQVATIAGLGDLSITSLNGDIDVGKNEKISAVGDLELAGDVLTFGDLSALGSILVDGQEVRIRTRAAGLVQLPDGSFVMDEGVDIIAGGDIVFTHAPVGFGTGAVPFFAAGGSISSALDGFGRTARNVALDDMYGPGKGITVLDLTVARPGAGGDGGVTPPPVISRDPFDIAQVLDDELRPVKEKVDRDVVPTEILERLAIALRELSVAELRSIAEGRAIYLDNGASSLERSPVPAVNSARLSKKAVLRLVDRYSRLFVVASRDPATGEVVSTDRTGEIAADLAAAVEAYARTGASDPSGLRDFASANPARAMVVQHLDGLRDVLVQIRNLGTTPAEQGRSVRALLEPVLPEGWNLADLEAAIDGPGLR